MRLSPFMAGAAAGALAWSGSAAAQDSSVAHAAGPDAIIVTATKRESSVQDVPISMQVLDGASLADNNVNDIKDLASQIPGMSFQISPTVPIVALRGFGTSSNNPAYDQTVAVYQDGIFAGRARQYQAPFFDLERVEVLRGPQGALLGKNTSAGAINFISAAPTDHLQASATATYLFDRDGIDIGGHVSGPLTPTLSARLAVHYLTTTDGYVFNTATGRGDPRNNIFSGRLSLRWEPSDGVEMMTRFEYSDVVDRGTVAANFPGTVPLEDIIDYHRDYAGAFGVEDGLRLKPYQFSNTLSIDLGPVTLVSVTGYQGYKGSNASGGGTANPENFGLRQSEKWSQGSQELRLLSSPGGRFEWIAGVYGDFSDFDVDYGIRYNLFGGAFDGQGRALFAQKAYTLSAYGTGTYRIADALRAIAGVRWTHIRKKADFEVVQDFGVPFGYVPGNEISQAFSEQHFDPSLTLEYDVAPDVMLYGGWSRGSKGGAFQATNRTVTPEQFALKPEKAEAFEVGLKSEPADWLTFNVAAFQLTFRNQQAGQYVGTPPQLINVNVGKSRSRGVEWTIGLKPSRFLSLTAVGTYLDAKYIDYPGAPCTFEQLADGCVNGTINAAGRRLAAQSKWSGNLNADFRAPLNPRLDFFLSANVEYRSRFNVDANVQNPFFGYQDGVAKLNGRVGIGGGDGGWEVALVVRNLFDTLTVNSAFPWGPPFVAGQTVVSRVDPPRSVGLQFKLNL